MTKIKEKLLTYPNVMLNYAAKSRTGTGFGEIQEIINRKYGYILKPGQILKTIRYHDVNYDIFVNPTVIEILKDGLIITHLLQTAEDTPIFVPFQKSLPAAGKYEAREMYVEPCECLYEKNKLSDVLSGNIETSHMEGKKLVEGIWYKHGGWRTKSNSSDNNLKNFVKLGQAELF